MIHAFWMHGDGGREGGGRQGRAIGLGELVGRKALLHHENHEFGLFGRFVQLQIDGVDYIVKMEGLQLMNVGRCIQILVGRQTRFSAKELHHICNR